MLAFSLMLCRLLIARSVSFRGWPGVLIAERFTVMLQFGEAVSP